MSPRRRMVLEIAAGCLIGLVISGVLIYGIVELADWIVEQTHHDLSTPR